MFDISKVKMLPKNRKQGLTLPKEPSEDLAYFCGLMAGDGHIGVREHKHDYLVQCEGNPKDEKEFYHSVVCPLIKKLFNIILLPKHLQTTYGIQIRSKAIVQYLTEILGLPKNRKYNQLTIPSWIRQDKKLVINYIRGLADTDFCLTLKRMKKEIQYYPVITGVSESNAFIEEIAIELELLGFKLSRDYNRVCKDVRFKKGYSITNRFALSGGLQLLRWMQIIGFYSPKHLNKFKLWQERNQNSKTLKLELPLLNKEK